MQVRTSSGLIRLALVTSVGAMCFTSFSGCGGPPSGDGVGGTPDGGQDTGGGGASAGGSLTGGASAGGGGEGQGDGGAMNVGGSLGGAGASGGGAPSVGGLGGSGALGGAGTGGSFVEDCGPELDVTGPFIPPVVVLDEPAVVPMGGPLVDGIYDLTSFVFYEDFPVESLAEDFRQVVRVRDGGTALDSFSTGGGLASPASYAITSIEGTNLMILNTCPLAGFIRPYPYSASPGELIIFIDYGTAVAVGTHTLRE